MTARWSDPHQRNKPRNGDRRAVTTLRNSVSVAVLRWLFDLVIIVGYIAVSLVLGAWLMLAVPIVLAAVVIVVTIVWVRLGES
jgi:hypothetical protein